MKNTNYIINGVLAVAVIILFVLQFTGNKSPKSVSQFASTDSTNVELLPIAYIRTDSLLTNYNYYKDLSDKVMSKIEAERATIHQREVQLQKEIVDFQQKAQNNYFLSRERAQQEQQRLERKGQELEEYAGRIQQEIALQQAQMQQQLSDTITSSLKEFNRPKKYQLILSNVGTDNIFYADQAYDITQEVIEFLNARYISEKK